MKEQQLKVIEEQVLACRKCGLCELALNAVPGEGNPNADLVFIGEAPGANEDKTGRPFVGRAGQLLDKMLEQIDMNRSEVWIGNVIKHRPPKNRDPLPAEIRACEPYLTTQIEVIQPKLIVTLGRFAMNYFYKDGKITRDHGNLITIGRYHVFPVYHPAAALRNRTFAATLLKDFLKIPEILKSVELKKETQKEVISSNPLGI